MRHFDGRGRASGRGIRRTPPSEEWQPAEPDGVRDQLTFAAVSRPPVSRPGDGCRQAIAVRLSASADSAVSTAESIGGANGCPEGNVFYCRYVPGPLSPVSFV